MKVENCRDSFKKIAGFVGITSASALLCFPALAQPNLRFNNFSSLLSHTYAGQSTLETSELFAQSNTDGGVTTNESTRNTTVDRATIRGSTFSVMGCNFVPIPRPSGGGTRERISTINRCEQLRQ